MSVLSVTFKAVDALSNALDKMGDAGEDALDQWSRSNEEASEAMETAIRRTEEFRDTNRQLAEELDRLQDAYIGAALDNGENSNQAKAYKQQIDELSDALDRQEKELEDLERAAGKTGETSANAMKTLESVLTGAAIVMAVKQITDAFLAASDAAAEYETCIAKVSTVADTSQVNMGDMADEITALSAETGKSVSELSDAVYNAISATGDTANAVGLASSATKLATAGFTDTGSALSVLTATLNAYGLEAGEVTAVSDSLIATQNLGVTTIDQLASSMGKAISTASAYGVDLYNLESAYVSLTKSGISTEESTTYLASMFNELGSASSEVSAILQEETGATFGQLMNSGYSLADVLSILYDSTNNNSEALMNLWGSAEAGKASNAIVMQGLEAFDSNLNAISGSAGTTATAYDAMMDTTEAANMRMQNSVDNLSIAFGNGLNPTLEVVYGAVADVADGLTEIVNEHPWVVAAVSAMVAGGVALAGVFVVTKVAALASIPSLKAFGAALWAATGPVGLAVAGVAALAAGVAVLVNLFKSEDEEFMALDATSKQHIETMDNLNAQYDEAVALYGENSEQARRLEQDIAALEAQYEGMDGTIEDYIAKNDALIESHDKLISSYQETDSQLTSEERNTTALIGKLEQLAGKTDLTAGEQQQMSAIVAKLNQQVPGLALNYDDLTGSLDRSVTAVKAMAEAEAEEQRQQANYEAYVGLLADRADLEEQIAKATEQTAAAQERYDNASGWDQFWDVGGVKDDLETFTEEQERLQAALEETNGLLEEHEAAFEEAASSAEDSAIDYETGVTRAITSVKEDLDTLTEKYDEAWQAARDSIGSQIGLFDEMATETELSISDMTTAMQSQVEYLNTYSENLRLAAEYGLDEGLIASLSDGSAESAGYIDAIISNIEKLGGSTEGLSTEAAAFVSDFNSQFQEVENAKDGWTTTVTKMEEDFDASMNEIEERLREAIKNMTMDTEAAAAAQATIDAYVSSIWAGVDNALGAKNSVASATSAALSGSGSVTGYATGTTYAEPGVHIVGEEGPEAIFFDGGETVLNASDTRQYLASQRPIQTSVPAPDAELEGGSIPGGERRIILEIAGRGSLELTGGNVDEDAAAEWLMENLRPLLISTLKQEIFEEGDATNAY